MRRQALSTRRDHPPTPAKKKQGGAAVRSVNAEQAWENYWTAYFRTFSPV